MKRGRPSDYSEKIANEICDRMANGESLREICRDDKMPSKRTVLIWLRKHEEFVTQYSRAREALMEHWAEEIVEIADDGTNDWMRRQRETKGVQVVENAEAINRSRLRVDTRKWLMSKLAAKKYGDKIDHEVSGGVQVVIQSKDQDL